MKQKAYDVDCGKPDNPEYMKYWGEPEKKIEAFNYGEDETPFIEWIFR